MKDCIFCQIVNKEIPADIIYEDDSFLVFKDKRPEAPLHLLLIPKMHLSQPPGSLSASQQQLLGKLFELARSIAEKQGILKAGYRLVNNNGPWAGQMIDHFHLHFLADKSAKKKS
jgi:histidine triad (HIT) family protein